MQRSGLYTNKKNVLHLVGKLKQEIVLLHFIQDFFLIENGVKKQIYPEKFVFFLHSLNAVSIEYVSIERKLI